MSAPETAGNPPFQQIAPAGGAASGPAIPVTLLTGFLGSGKTTVLNHLLADPRMGRTAVIINEFGEVGLDHELVVSSTESMVLLQSGCICCALRGDLLDMLIELAARREAGELDFDRVIIESSGLSDPAPVLHTLLTSMDLSERYAMDGVVCTLDLTSGAAVLERHEEARRQVAMADLLLLTKGDLAPEGRVAAQAAVQELNPAVAMREVVQGRVPPEALVGLGHFDPQMKSEQVQDWLRAEASPRPGPVDPLAYRHLDAIRSVAWSWENPISPNIFDMWMSLLMARRGEDLLRVKGLIHLQGATDPVVIHGVQHIFHPPVPLRDWQGNGRQSKIVMILRGFVDPELRDLFQVLNTPPANYQTLNSGYFSDQVTG